MRKPGSILLGAGVLLGICVPVVMVTSVSILPSLPWIVAIGMAKLVLLGSGGLMAAGAVRLMLARRAEPYRAVRTDTRSGREQSVNSPDPSIRKFRERANENHPTNQPAPHQSTSTGFPNSDHCPAA